MSIFTAAEASQTSVTSLPDPAFIDALGDYQASYGSFVFGEGTEHALSGSLEGLLALDTRVGDQPIPQGDGDISFGRWAAGRIITFPFVIFGVPHSQSFIDSIKEWELAFNISSPYGQEWLLFKTPYSVYAVRAKVVRRSVEVSPTAASAGRSHAVVEFKIADPRVYDGLLGVESILVATEPAEGGGLDLGFDLGFDMAAAEGGSSIATNSGNANAAPLLRIVNDAGAGGNITRAIVTNVTTGVIFDITTAVTPGQTLVVDFDAMIRAEPAPHIHIDYASRYGDWAHPRVPLLFVPGTNVLIADVTGGDATVRADWLNPTI
jgi:hypothetical protein